MDRKYGTDFCDHKRQKDLTTSSYRKCDRKWLFWGKNGEHYKVISCQQLQQQFPILLIVVISFYQLELIGMQSRVFL